MSKNKQPITNEFAQTWLGYHSLSVSRNPKGVVSLRSEGVDGALGVGTTLRHAVIDAFKKSPVTLDNADTAGALFMAAALDASGDDILDVADELWPPEVEDGEEGEEEDTEDEDSEDEDSEDDDSEDEDAEDDSEEVEQEKSVRVRRS